MANASLIASALPVYSYVHQTQRLIEKQELVGSSVDSPWAVVADATHERCHAGFINLSEAEFGLRAAVNVEGIAKALARDLQLLGPISRVGWVL